MSEPFIAQVKAWGLNFAPRSWAFCSGQLLSIAQNNALFALIGTNYGGDGRTTMGLPDFRSRMPVGLSNTFPQLGMKGGSEQVTLTANQMAQHTHAVFASTDSANSNTPENTIWATTKEEDPIYAAPANLVPMNDLIVSSTGSSQPHENRMPSLAITFCIALEGIFPSRN